MNTNESQGARRYDTIVIGGGQAGLAAGYYLAWQQRSFVILDASDHTGDSWRHRWDSLRLFTPARFDGLPGMRYPGPRHIAPSKDEFADYLEAYTQRFRLPVQHGVRVKRLSKIDDEFVVETAHGIWSAASIVVATGGYQLPVIPAYADSLDPRIVQLHSGDYRNPSQLRSGDVLLVGAGNSGADICMEVGRFHRTYLSGNDTGHVPFRIEGRPGRYLVPLVRFLGHHVLNYGTPIGRRAIPGMIGKGGPLIRVKPHEITAAGVERLPCVTGVHEGKPLLEDGRVVDVTNVIWCTGFRRDFSWIDLPTFGPEGEPEHLRGVAIGEPNVAFVGLPFQYAATSDVITGVARDAAYVVKRIGKHRRLNAPEREPSIAGESPYKEPARRAR